MASNHLSKHFWQVIYPSDVQEGTLMLSEEFVTKYGRRLSNTTELKLPDGKVWKIVLKRENEDHKCRVWLESGFRHFLQHYSIAAGFLLMFEFRGSSNFHVLVFDRTSCEIVYTIRQPAPEPQQHSVADPDSNFCSRVEASAIITGLKFRSTFGKMCAASKRASKRAIERAIESNPENPSFLISILKYHLVAGFMNFPTEFTRCYMWEDSQQVKVQVFNEEEETMLDEVLLNMSTNKSSGMKHVTGWMSFCRDNDLKEGDVCLFELIDPASKLFTVRKFHARSA
ncbi:B3 domain-containing transcription factor VRN1 [Linum perenne]